MFSTPINKSFFISAFFGILLCSGSALGDTVYEKDTIRYGKITAYDQDNVSFSEGCNQKVEKIPMTTVRLLRFDAPCVKPDRADPNPGGFNLDTCNPKTSQIVFIIPFDDGNTVYASAVEMKEDKTVILKLANSKKVLRGPSNSITLMNHLCIEKTSIANTNTFPSGFSKK
jgi:hypothetical protein